MLRQVPPPYAGPVSNRELLHWMLAVALALVALTGIVLLIVAVMLVVALPRWVEIPVGVGLTIAACLYAWALVAAVERPPQE